MANFKNTAQFSASHIFSAEFRPTYLRLIFWLSRIFLKVKKQCFINHTCNNVITNYNQ